MKSTDLRVLPVILLTLCAVCQFQPQVLCNDMATPESAEHLVGLLISKSEDQPTAEMQDICKRVEAMQDSAVPAIVSGLNEAARKSPPHTAEFMLMATLKRIKTETATKALLDLGLNPPDSDLSRLARGHLWKRPIPYSLTDEEHERLTKAVDEGPAFSAGHMACILANCTSLPLEDRFQRIVRRFIAEIQIDSEHVGPFARSAVEYLQAFANLGEGATTLVYEARRIVSGKASKKWLLLAQGMTGDASVAEEIRRVIDADSEARIRWAAIPAYSRAARQAAIPFLKSLLNDKTETESWLPHSSPNRPDYYIAQTAKSELLRLEQENPEK